MGFFGALQAKSGALLARGIFSLSAGLGFPFTKQGVRVVVLAQLGLAAVALGPSRAVKLGFQATMLAVAGRTVVVLAKTLPQKMELDQDAQQQMWEWDPPGELGESGAWRVVRELAQALTKGSDEFPELQDMQTLPLQELAVRLCYKFDDGQQHPEVDEEVEGADDGAVTSELLDKLARYLHFANLIYEAPTDRTLGRLLRDQGFILNFSKLEADWEAKAPAFFFATNQESKELLLSVRGTSQLDDVITDITAVPEDFDDTGEQAHGGMAAGAQWLLERVLPLAQGMHDAGFSVKIVGHSLGGGMSALLGIMLQKRGVTRVECYGFATPPCCTPPLAKKCEEFFQDVAFRSDIVSRFSPQSLAGLHEQLRAIDWRSDELKERQKTNPMLGNVAKLAGAVNRLAALFGGAGDDQEQEDAEAREKSMADTEKQLSNYQPVKPGRVLYCYRSKPELDAQGDALGRTLVTGSCKQLRNIHVNAYMVQDHTIPQYFLALERSNPLDSEEEKKKEKEEVGEAEDEGCEEQNDDDAE